MDVHPTKNVSIGIDPYPVYFQQGVLLKLQQGAVVVRAIAPFQTLPMAIWLRRAASIAEEGATR
jgi:hypothetical protein